MGAEDAISNAAIRRVERIRAAVIARARSIIAKAPKDEKGRLTIGTQDELMTLARIRSDCTALIRSARNDVEPIGDDAIDSVIGAVSKKGERVGFSFDAKAKAQIRSAVAGVLDRVSESFTVAVDDIRAAVDAGANSSASLKNFIDAVAEKMGTPFSRAATAVDTAIRGAWRYALVLQAERGAKETGVEMGFLYLGPDDGKIRPFCEENVDKVFTLKALKRLDNGQDLPVEIFAGGYNCRHTLSPIDLADAKAEGYKIVRR